MALPTIHEDIAYDEQFNYIPILTESKSTRLSPQEICVQYSLMLITGGLIVMIIYYIPHLAANEIIFISLVIALVALIVAMLGIYAINYMRPNEQLVIARIESIA